LLLYIIKNFYNIHRLHLFVLLLYALAFPIIVHSIFKSGAYPSPTETIIL